jgi:hypothetical protein
MRLYLKSKLVRAGLALLVIGTGPLLSIILAAKLGFTDDPNPNPVIFGILAMLTFWPSLIMIGIGVAMVRRSISLAAMGRSDPRVPLPDGLDADAVLKAARDKRDRV